MRASNRRPDQLRPVSIERGVNKYAEGSALIRCGDTHVLCTASVEEKVPPFLRGKNQGWVTAEYGMLPRATHERTVRESARGKQQGRTVEIQRLIGRSLRAVVDLTALGERAITIDCDVLQADGGTRTAAISGGFVALADAIRTLIQQGRLKQNPLHGQLAAVSVGVYRGTPLLDLEYAEDSEAETDMNIRRPRLPPRRNAGDARARRQRHPRNHAGAKASAGVVSCWLSRSERKEARYSARL